MAAGIEAAPLRRAPAGRLGRGFVAALGLLVLWGLAAWIYQLTQGLIATGMRDLVSWGLYIFTFAFLVGLSAGGLIMASAAEVFGVRSLRPLARLGVLTAAACVLVAAMTIIPDLGNPQRVWELFRYPNWTSPLVWDVLIILAYLAFALADLTVMSRKRIAPSRRARILRTMAYAGLPMAVLLHSITAWIFGLQIARPWWNTALMAPLFVTSAILSGAALVTLVALAARRFDRIRLGQETWTALAGLMAATIAVDLFLVACDYITILWGNVPRERAALDLILPGGSWQWLFWLEWIVGGAVPFALLVVPRLRRRLDLLALASALVLVGVYAFRIELVVGGMLRPLLHFAPGNALGQYRPGQASFQFDGVYHPTWVEYAIVTALLAFLALLVTLGYRWLRPVERADAEA
ncbi:MAG TPA: NrfD/PsrC family molybdoenzyme membrane anchor subunit [Gaiellaceae bacterium]|jgi:molybdopterin-containing oxidoreductase family membrane subunit|nr:NrfD/PsrC family molybdoenzyme membrane anchor subunit [Gaiellaceae bacterium]